jgi:endoglucanase
MKKLINRVRTIAVVLMSASVLTTLNACSGDNTESITPNVTLSQKYFSFSSEGGSKSLSIESNIPIEISDPEENWCSVSRQENPTKNVFQFTITADPNTTHESRQTNINVTGNNFSETLTVEQSRKVKEGGNGETGSIIERLGFGWNMGNQLDAFNNGVSNETIWGNPKTTQTAFNKIAAAGISTVRIPVTWLGQIGDAPDYTIDEEWLNRVYEVVGYAENAGLNAIINIHHDGADSHHWLNIKDAATDETVNTQVKEQLRAMWTQIANKFKDKGHFLIFESMNEIHDGGWGWGDNRSDGGKQYATLNEWNQVFVDAVRATGGNNSDRYLGVPGYCTNPDLTIDHFVMPTDDAVDRLLVSVHYYDPYEYTLEAKFPEWGHTASADKKDDYGDEAHVKDVFGRLKSNFIDKGIPVYIGEMGCVHRSNDRAEAFRKYYLEYVCKAARTYGMAPVYWDNGATGAGRECSGLINHGTGEYINNGKEIIDAMVKAVTNDDESYTLQSVYDSAP